MINASKRMTDNEAASSYGKTILRDVLVCGEMKYTTLRLYARDGVPAKNVQKAVKRKIRAGMLKAVGKGPDKALRYVWSKENNAKVAELFGEAILEQFMRATNELHYTTHSHLYSDKQQRRWRMGEVCAMLSSIGCPIWRRDTTSNGLASYCSTDIRRACSDVNLAANSRLAATLISGAAAYAVYSIGSTLQRWNKEAERRGKRALEQFLWQNGRAGLVEDAICFYGKESIPLEYLTGHSRQKGTVKHGCIGIHNTSGVYRRFHLLPLDSRGKKMLRLICIPQLNRILTEMFSLTENEGNLSINCHGFDGKRAVFFAITGDMAGLHSFLTGYDMGLQRAVVCWDWQRESIEAFAIPIGNEIKIWAYEDALYKEIERRLKNV